MNSKLIKKYLIALSVCFLVSIFISSVCAQDINESNGDCISSNKTETIAISQDNNINDIGTTADLDMDISCLSPGDTYNFEKDYLFNDNSNQKRFYTGIIIKTDNITLNGNGHTIEGNLSAIFNVEGKNVKISNLTIKNTNTIRYANNLVPQYYKVSPINWMGNNGIISDCIFIDNAAINGGSLRWGGNNGNISNCIFMNNMANAVGGAIYILGANTTIEKSYFSNCTSLYSKDIIYSNPGIKVTLTDNNFKINDTNYQIIISGNNTGINADWFYELTYETIFGENVNFNEIVYTSMTKYYTLGNMMVSEISYLNKNLKYNIEYNGTSLYINFNKIIENIDSTTATGNLILGQSYQLKNMKTMKDIFISIHKKQYTIEDTAIAEYNIEDINAIKKISYDTLNKYIDFKKYENHIFLNILLPTNQTYKTNGLGNIFDHLSKYSGIVLNGNGSKILGPFDNNEKKKWTGLKVNKKDIIISITNLTIEGFNHAIQIDQGTCTLINVKLINNSCKYKIEHDWGGGIINMGICACYNCTFINNYAKYGAAIYNQGILIIDNTTIFLNNTAYKSGNEITYVDSASIIFNGIEYNGQSRDLKFNNGTYFIDYHEGFTPAAVKAMLAGAITSSFISGFCTGMLAGSPWVGLLLGAIEGLSIGAVMTMFVLRNNYDYHRSNVNTALLFIGTSVAAGMIGGFIGGLIGQKILQNKMIKEDFEIVGDTSTEENDPNLFIDQETGMIYNRDGYGVMPAKIETNAIPSPDISGPV